MRVDVTQRPVGSFFGGTKQAANSIECGLCGRAGLWVKTTIRGGHRVHWVCHGFELKLNIHNEPEIAWDEPCLVSDATAKKRASAK